MGRYEKYNLTEKEAYRHGYEEGSTVRFEDGRRKGKEEGRQNALGHELGLAFDEFDEELAKKKREGFAQGYDAGRNEADGIARTRGYEEGKKEGIAQGREEGKKEGIAQGREEGKKEGIAQGREEGKKEGIAQGREEGKKESKAQGREEGKKEGIAQGREEGKKEGIAQGREEGKKEGIRLGVLWSVVGGVFIFGGYVIFDLMVS